jgi:hypothetical protein
VTPVRNERVGLSLSALDVFAFGAERFVAVLDPLGVGSGVVELERTPSIAGTRLFAVRSY